MSGKQLFFDQMPVPREAWNYDAADRILTWRGAYGGRLHMTHDGCGATGVIGLASLDGLSSVTAGTTASFDCDVALDTGATYETHRRPGHRAGVGPVVIGMVKRALGHRPPALELHADGFSSRRKGTSLASQQWNRGSARQRIFGAGSSRQTAGPTGMP